MLVKNTNKEKVHREVSKAQLFIAVLLGPALGSSLLYLCFIVFAGERFHWYGWVVITVVCYIGTLFAGLPVALWLRRAGTLNGINLLIAGWSISFLIGAVCIYMGLEAPVFFSIMMAGVYSAGCFWLVAKACSLLFSRKESATENTRSMGSDRSVNPY